MKNSKPIQQRLTKAKALLYVLECSVSDFSEGATPEIDNSTMASLTLYARMAIAELEALIDKELA